MKVKFTVLFIVFCLCLFTSCAQKQNYLSYQRCPMRISGTLYVDGLSCNLTLTMKESDVGEITLDSPERLSGYRFAVNNEGIWVYYDDISLPLEENGLGVGISTLVDMFSLDPESLSEIGSKKIGETEHIRLVYPKNDIAVSVYINPNETIPVKLEAQKENSCIIFGVDSISYK